MTGKVTERFLRQLTLSIFLQHELESDTDSEPGQLIILLASGIEN